MRLTDKQKKSQDILQQVFDKAWSDEEFKKVLMTNPVETIEQLTGERIQLSEGKKLVVRDQTDDTIIYINIPVEPKMDDMNLSEEQLEYIAGGGDIWSLSMPTLPIDIINKE